VNGRIVLEGNMNGGFKMRVEADSVRVESAWSGLVNPVLDQDQLMDGEEREHPSQTRDPDEYAAVRVEAKDWARVVKVGALGKRVIACMSEHISSSFPSLSPAMSEMHVRSVMPYREQIVLKTDNLDAYGQVSVRIMLWCFTFT